MKKWIVSSGFLLLLVAGFSSCGVNRDCYGVKHTTLSNGVRI